MVLLLGLFLCFSCLLTLHAFAQALAALVSRVVGVDGVPQFPGLFQLQELAPTIVNKVDQLGRAEFLFRLAQVTVLGLVQMTGFRQVSLIAGIVTRQASLAEQDIHLGVVATLVPTLSCGDGPSLALASGCLTDDWTSLAAGGTTRFPRLLIVVVAIAIFFTATR